MALAGTGLSATLTTDGRIIVEFLLRLFHLDENDAEHVALVITILKAHENVE